MNYAEAIAKSLSTRWKTEMCSDSGNNCWCRIVVPEEKIIFDTDEELYIVGSGKLPKEYAEYIVNLHNQSLSNPK